MSPSTNTCYISTDNTTISTEASTLPASPSHYLTQTDFSTTIGKQIASFNDNNSKQDAKFREIISEQDAKFDAKF